MKNILLIVLLFVSSLGMSQEVRTGTGKPFIPSKYGNDIIIKSDSLDQGNTKLAIAFNGWLYSAFTTINNTDNSGGITIRSSKDNGATWTTLDSYLVPNAQYTAFDIVVSGTDTNTMKLTLVGVRKDLLTSEYILFIDNYNATNGNFIGSPYNISTGTRIIYDVAIATDYRFPAVGASPYSIGIAYSVGSSTYDSINSITSLDGGVSYTVFNNIASTSAYFRKVSLAYGRSTSGSNGRYFAAWEKLGTSFARNGNIYTSRNSSTIDSYWITPVNLDSVSTSMIGLCRNPTIASQYNDVDNDSGSVTTIVLVERDYNADGSDYDLLGFYNMRSHYTNYWFRLDIVNSGEMDLQPDITYDPTYNNFLAVYFDSTNKKLPYCVNGNNLTTPSTWTYITPQYNDDSNLTAPWPKVEINPFVTQTAHVWTKNSGTKGVAMFDAEYIATSIEEQQDAGMFSDDQLYPNPATDLATLQFSMAGDADITIRIFNATGSLMESRTATNRKAGAWMETFDVQNWNNGIYIISVQSNKESFNRRLVVTH